MTEVVVAHHPELTAARAMEVFRRHFGEGYEVYKPRFYGRLAHNFILKKSACTGVGVKLKHQWNSPAPYTSFSFSVLMPSVVLGMVLAAPAMIPYLLVTRLFLKSTWNAMEEEVRAFIENAPEFN